MKNFKVSSLFHWLYASVMFLPILLLPVFMIYSHRHEINDGSIQVQEKQAVDFNQIVDTFYINGNQYVDNVTLNNPYSFTLNGTFDGRYTPVFVSQVTFDVNHIYYFKTNWLFNVHTSDWSINSVADSRRFINATQTTQNILFDDLQTGSISYSYETFYLQIYDLTKMFGVGNEPSIEEFNSLFPNTYYEYTQSKKMLVAGDLVTYNDTDIMSQFTYQLYHSVDKYFNISQFFGFENLWDFMLLNWFGGNFTIYLRIFWQLLTYWLVISIAWLIFDLFMYVPKLAHRWLDRSAIE